MTRGSRTQDDRSEHVIEQTAPYWLILTAAFLPVLACLYAYVRIAALSDSPRVYFGLVPFCPVVCLASWIILLGLPIHYDSLSLALQLISYLTGTLLIFSVSGWVLAGQKTKGSTPDEQISAGLRAGLLMIVPAILVMATMSCVLAGYCL